MGDPQHEQYEHPLSCKQFWQTFRLLSGKTTWSCCRWPKPCGKMAKRSNMHPDSDTVGEFLIFWGLAGLRISWLSAFLLTTHVLCMAESTWECSLGWSSCQLPDYSCHLLVHGHQAVKNIRLWVCLSSPLCRFPGRWPPPSWSSSTTGSYPMATAQARSTCLHYFPAPRTCDNKLQIVPEQMILICSQNILIIMAVCRHERCGGTGSFNTANETICLGPLVSAMLQPDLHLRTDVYESLQRRTFLVVEKSDISSQASTGWYAGG